MAWNEHLRSQPWYVLSAYSLSLVLLIGVVDYLTGYEFGLDLFYLFPIAFATWYIGVRAGVFFAVLTVNISNLSDYLAGKVYTNFGLALWDSSIRFGFYLVVAVLIARLRTTMRERSKLIGELQATLKEVKELRGILPICSSCKKIRTDEGYWQNVEEYISHHTNAEFSHGICQECAMKLYPRYYNKEGKKQDKP